MSQDQKNDITEYDLDHLVQSSFNYGDDYLLEKMQKAEQTISDDQIPPEPEDGFERLMAKIKEGSISAYSASDEDLESRRSAPAEEPERRRKKRRLHTIIRIAIAAAIVGSVFTMTSVSVGAKKSYKYEAKSLDGERNKIIINNQANKNGTDALNEAYEEIHNQLGIRVLRLKSKPKEMEYLKTVYSHDRATMYFQLNGKILTLMQQIKTTEHSQSIVSEREKKKTVYNEWLRLDIIIEKANTDDGTTEFSTSVIEGNGCYYLSGIVDDQVFTDIVLNLDFAE